MVKLIEMSLHPTRVEVGMSTVRASKSLLLVDDYVDRLFTDGRPIHMYGINAHAF